MGPGNEYVPTQGCISEVSLNFITLYITMQYLPQNSCSKIIILSNGKYGGFWNKKEPTKRDVGNQINESFLRNRSLSSLRFLKKKMILSSYKQSTDLCTDQQINIDVEV